MKKLFINQPVQIAVIIAAILIVLVGWSRRLTQLTQGTALNTAPSTLSVAETLAEQVIPEQGYAVDVNWGEIGQKLVAAGGIDLAKYQQNYSDDQSQKLMTYLTSNENSSITINQDTAYFWVNTLWALGLTQRSEVLDKGVMGTEYKGRVGSFASTGGWTFGAKNAVELYSSAELIPLTAEQQTLVYTISQNIYRPCCDNPTSFPDCNHGMAILGLIELMVSQGYSEADTYKAALAFNSYWFAQTYTDLAYYFQTKEKTAWKDVDPKRVLSAEFSSASGYQAIKKIIGPIPGTPAGGASCGT